MLAPRDEKKNGEGTFPRTFGVCDILPKSFTLFVTFVP